MMLSKRTPNQRGGGQEKSCLREEEKGNNKLKQKKHLSTLHLTAATRVITHFCGEGSKYTVKTRNTTANIFNTLTTHSNIVQ